MVLTVVLARAEEGTISPEENLPPASKQTGRKGSLSVFSLLSLSSTQNNPYTKVAHFRVLRLVFVPRSLHLFIILDDATQP